MSYQTILDMVLSGIIPSILVAIFCSFLYRRKKQKHLYLFFLFTLYISMLLYVTVYRYGIDISELFQERPQVNLQPLIYTIQLYQFGGWDILLYNIIGNIAWFIPFGFLLPILSEHVSWKRILLLTFMLSSSIEILQFLLNCGISDIDDVMFNVCGGCLGYATYLVWGKFRKIAESDKKREC